jgi:hypothetical protein
VLNVRGEQGTAGKQKLVMAHCVCTHDIALDDWESPPDTIHVASYQGNGNEYSTHNCCGNLQSDKLFKIVNKQR